MKLHEEFKLYEELWEAVTPTYTVLVDKGWSKTKSPHLSLNDAIVSTRRSLFVDGVNIDIVWIDEQTNETVFEYDARLQIIQTNIGEAKDKISKVLADFRERDNHKRQLDKFLQLFTSDEIDSMKSEIDALRQKITQIEVARSRQLEDLKAPRLTEASADKDEIMDDLYYRGMKRDFGVYEDTVAYSMTERAMDVFDMNYDDAENLAWKVISRMKNNDFEFIKGEE